MQKNASPDSKIALGILFVVLTAIYLVSSSGGFHNIDEVSIFSVTESLVRRGAFDVNSIAWTRWAVSPAAGLEEFGPGGDSFAKKGPAPAFLAVPFYLIGWLIPALPMLETTLWLNAVITALSALLVAKIALTLNYRLRTVISAGLIFGLATIAFPYAKQFFGEPTASLGLVWAFYALLRFKQSCKLFDAAMAGLALGIMIAANAAMAVLLVPFGLYFVWILFKNESKLKSIFAFGSLLALTLALVAGYNWLRFGTPLTTGYHLELGEGFTADLRISLWGLLLSPYKGFFWFTPFAFASLMALPQFLRRHRAEAWLAIGTAVVTVVLFAKWWIWWGAVSWGPRFLVPLAPLVVIVALPLIDAIDLKTWASRVVVALIVVSFLVQLLAVSVNYLNFEVILSKLYQSDWYALTRTGPPALYNPAHSPILGQLSVLLNSGKVALDLGWVLENQIALEVPLIGLAVILFAIAAWKLNQQARAAFVGLAVIALGTLAVVSAQAYGSRPEFGDSTKGFGAALAQVSKSAGEQDGIVTIAPYFYQVPMVQYRGRLPIYGYSQEALPLHAETEAVLSRALVRHPRLWFITVGLSPASPDNGIEMWLARNAYKADDQWFDDARLVTYVTVREMKPLPIQQQFGDVRLTSVKTSRSNLRAGDTLAIELTWQANVQIKNDLHAFIQLLAPDSSLLVGQDGVPGAGYSPSASWQPNVPVSDRHGLVMPAELAPGEYTLIAGIYDAANGERLKTADGKDFVVLDHPVVR